MIAIVENISTKEKFILINIAKDDLRTSVYLSNKDGEIIEGFNLFEFNEKFKIIEIDGKPISELLK